MSSFKVVVTDYVFPDLEPEKEILSEVGAELVAGQCETKSEVIELVPGADAVLNTYYGPIDGDVMDAMPECRIIVRYGVGVDTIDIPAATDRGIMVANVPDYCVDEVSDQAVTMTLALLRKLPQADRMVRSGEWALAELKPMRRISTLTVGIIGLGRIGKAIAAKILPFGSRIIYCDPYADSTATPALTSVELDELLRTSDAIIIQAPSTPQTRHMLNADAFAAMARQPVLVNCARGDLIDTDALVNALEQGQISGAGLDVIENTPPLPEDHPLLSFDNVILTPHSAWFSGDALDSLQRLGAMEVARALKGEQPKHLVNPEVLE